MMSNQSIMITSVSNQSIMIISGANVTNDHIILSVVSDSASGGHFLLYRTIIYISP